MSDDSSVQVLLLEWGPELVSIIRSHGNPENFCVVEMEHSNDFFNLIIEIPW